MGARKRFRDDVDTGVEQSDYAFVRVLPRVLVWVAVAIFVLGGIGVLYTLTIGKEQANADREVFKSTVAYTESMASFLAKSYKEYNGAENDAAKKATMEYVVMRYPNIDTDTIDNATLKDFYDLCLKGGK